jgi:hypothetical protein
VNPWLDHLTATMDLAAARSVLREIIILADQVSALTNEQLRFRLLTLAAGAAPRSPAAPRSLVLVRINSSQVGAISFGHAFALIHQVQRNLSAHRLAGLSRGTAARAEWCMSEPGAIGAISAMGG